jgi:hypothetical protein
MFCTPDYSQMMITVLEPTGDSQQGWSAENGLFIAAPAEKRQQAIGIAENYSRKVAWIKNVNWNE